MPDCRNHEKQQQHVTMVLHPTEAELIQYLRKLRYGRVERLEVQEGLPVLAEEVREKVRFGKK